MPLASPSVLIYVDKQDAVGGFGHFGVGRQ